MVPLLPAGHLRSIQPSLPVLLVAVLLLCEAVGGPLTLQRYANTALAGSGAQRSLLDTLSVSLPGALPFSAEASGSFSPRVASNATW